MASFWSGNIWPVTQPCRSLSLQKLRHTPLKFVTCPLIVERHAFPKLKWSLEKGDFYQFPGRYSLYVAIVLLVSQKNWKVGHYLSRSLDSWSTGGSRGKTTGMKRDQLTYTKKLQLWHLDLGWTTATFVEINLGKYIPWSISYIYIYRIYYICMYIQNIAYTPQNSHSPWKIMVGRQALPFRTVPFEGPLFNCRGCNSSSSWLQPSPVDEAL